MISDLDEVHFSYNLHEIRKFIAVINPQSPYAINGQGSESDMRHYQVSSIHLCSECTRL
jgi:hypothetical protein